MMGRDNVKRAWVLILLTMLIAFVMSVSAEEETKYPYSLSDFCVDLRLFAEPSDNVKYADLLMDGELFVDTNIKETFPYEIDSLDWNMEVTQSPATYQLYLQSLGMIKFLSNATLITENMDYIELAE